MNIVEQDAAQIVHVAEGILGPIVAAAALASGDALLQAAGAVHVSSTYATAAALVLAAAVAYWQTRVRPWLAGKSGARGTLVTGTVEHFVSGTQALAGGAVEAVALPALPIVDPALVVSLVEDALRQHLAQHAAAETLAQ